MQIEHHVQLSILKQLLFNPKARFRDLNKTDLTNDHFTFHLKRLVELDLISKFDNIYSLTPQGLELAGRLDIKSMKVINPPKVGVCLLIYRYRNDKLEILLEERLKDPSKGKIGSHTEKVRFGESLYETTKRCLKNETGLEGNFKYCGVIRIIRIKNKYPFLDVLLNYFKVENPKGKLLKKTEASKNTWIEYKQALKIQKTFENYQEDLKKILSDKLFLEERIINL